MVGDCVEQDNQRTAETEAITGLTFLDFAGGLERCMGDRSFYLELLASFAEDNQLADLQRLYLAKDWQEYRIRVHALKSSSAYIGADRLSAWAKRMELAVGAQDMDYVQRNHGAFMEYFENILKQLAGAGLWEK